VIFPFVATESSGNLLKWEVVQTPAEPQSFTYLCTSVFEYDLLGDLFGRFSGLHCGLHTEFEPWPLGFACLSGKAFVFLKSIRNKDQELFATK